MTLFPATPWGDAWLIARGVDADTLQVSSAASPAAFAQLVGLRSRTRQTSAERLLPFLEIVMQRHGVDAEPAVRALADAMGPEGVALIARVRTPETVRHLLDQLDGALAGPARAALIGMSDLTLATLARAGRLKKAAAELAEELVKPPGLVAALLPHLDPAAAKVVRRWAGEDEALPVTDDVPPALSAGTGRPLEPWIRLPSLPALRTPDGSHAYPPAACAHAIERMSDDEAVEAAADALLDVCDPASLDALLAELLLAWSDGPAHGIYGTSPWRLLREDYDG